MIYFATVATCKEYAKCNIGFICWMDCTKQKELERSGRVFIGVQKSWGHGLSSFVITYYRVTASFINSLVQLRQIQSTGMQTNEHMENNTQCLYILYWCTTSIDDKNLFLFTYATKQDDWSKRLIFSAENDNCIHSQNWSIVERPWMQTRIHGWIMA